MINTVTALYHFLTLVVPIAQKASLPEEVCKVHFLSGRKSTDMSVTEIVHVDEQLRSQGKESAERQAALSRLYAQGLHCLPIPVNPYAGR